MEIYILIILVIRQLYIFVKTHRIVYLKRVDDTVYKLYLNKPDV